MEKNKKRSSVTKALMWRITALALGLWLFMMCCITWACALHIIDVYLSDFRFEYDHIEWELMNSINPENGYDKADIQYKIIDSEIDLYAYKVPFMDSFACDDPYEYAVICYEYDDGNVKWLMEDGNFLYGYAARYEENTEVDYTAFYIDLDETQFGRDIVAESKEQHNYLYYEHYMDYGFRFDRLTGWVEGNKFHLVEVADYPDNISLLEEPEEEWITVVDTAEPGEELVHIYPNYVKIKRGSTKPVTVDGVTYDNLGDMLKSDVLTCDITDTTIFNSIFTSSVCVTDVSGVEYRLSVAVQFSPMKLAFISLLKFYAVTLVVLAFILFLIYRGIRKKLVKPMNKLLKLVAEDSLYMPEPEDYWWKEPYEVYVQPRNAIHELKKEINQLNTALEYAKDAEDNRKRMISNITHELKTPLAVIHSYAEGLQEGIAGEHQDRYLDVILEETDQMDGMVLEMLDLSRLEAGKVRLASDRFSLLELTKAVFDKLDPLMQEKKLKVEFLWPQDFQITADEARLAQVVTNLATNAIKYSPEGGMINVQIFQHNGRCHFTIENQSDPIPEENLKKLWDSFYRTDASRTEKGTGLGLTITKTIVELHGGTCAARNTPNGVQFEFELP